MMEISVSIGGSHLSPHRYTYSSGLSLVYVFAERTNELGIAFNPTKVQCAECNTPIAEIIGGSLIIRSKHHSSRHTTVFSKKDLLQLLN